MDSDYPRGTCENVLYHFHVIIQIIITSYLRPVCVFFDLKKEKLQVTNFQEKVTSTVRQ